jgi:hypothetical protein
MKARYHSVAGGAKIVFWALALTILVSLAPNASADPVPAGWTCNGDCGSSAANGVVGLSPLGTPEYQYVSTYQGVNGVGILPTGALGLETDGSTLATSTFTATGNTQLNFFFDYVTSDGSDPNTNYADYAWAGLFNSSNNLVALLFTARTEPSGSIVPGAGMPAPTATLTPGAVPIQPGTTWAPLGPTYSGQCYGPGCGNTGWVNANYTIQNAGNYYLEVGVVNWKDTYYDSGLAMDGVTINGVSINPTSTPEPGSLLFLGVAAGSLLLLRRRQVRI